MKTSIYIKNVEGKLFELSNTTKEKLSLAENYNHTLMSCGRYDIIIYKFRTDHPLLPPWEIVHKNDSKEQGQAIIKAINDILKTKSDLLHQRQVIKKMDHSQHLIAEISQKLRSQYFELSIAEYLV
ncbi:hypothetical protein [Paenibacillus periandrae]|uniref:hypothetical protein n=1 Tax=Paenibacillus periandrae TaxID=1761741 RepID=UPI001F08B6CB|nr:hypothetical protein [Paenibacillus periandrae]